MVRIISLLFEDDVSPCLRLLALAIKGWSVPFKGPSRPRDSLGTSCCCLRGGRKRNVCCPHGPDKLQKTGEWTDCPTETELHHCGTEQVSCCFLFLVFVSKNVEEAQSKCENRLKRSTFSSLSDLTLL